VLGFNQLTILRDLWRSFKLDFIEFKQDSNRTRFLMYFASNTATTPPSSNASK
jgi:hypothetical protein